MELRFETGNIDEIEMFQPGWMIPDIKKPTMIIEVGGRVWYKYADGHPLGVL